MPTLLAQKGTREVTSVTREHVQGILFLAVVDGQRGDTFLLFVS
jgi:hypothetical protein